MYSHHGLCNVQALRKMYRHCARAREMYRHLRVRAQNVQALQEKSENSSTPPLRLIFGRALTTLAIRIGLDEIMQLQK